MTAILHLSLRVLQELRNEFLCRRVRSRPTLFVKQSVEAEVRFVSHLLSGIATTGDDGNAANLEELHFDCWSGREGGWESRSCCWVDINSDSEVRCRRLGRQGS